MVCVDRDTGEATTSARITDKDKAWAEATRLEQPNIFTTSSPAGTARRGATRPSSEDSDLSCLAVPVLDCGREPKHSPSLLLRFLGRSPAAGQVGVQDGRDHLAPGWFRYGRGGARGSVWSNSPGASS